MLAEVGTPIAAVLVSTTDAETAGAYEVGRVRDALGPVVPNARLYGGTRGPFAFLNRATLDVDGLDGVAYTICPQEHAFDDASLFETLAVQEETVATTKAHYPGLDVVIARITLLPCAAAIADRRQRDLLTAAWTIGSIKYLVESGAARVTYFETSGPRGIADDDGVFPVYHALADVWNFPRNVLATQSSEPLAAIALAAVDCDATHVLVANLIDDATEVVLGPLPGTIRRTRGLREETLEAAAHEPARFRQNWQELPDSGSQLRFELAPYEVLRLEAA
jgi:hypothetical protein